MSSDVTVSREAIAIKLICTHHLIITYRADHPRAGSSCRLGSAVLIKSNSRRDVLILGGYRRAGGLRAEGNGTVRG
jgi:hypothetical protein